MRSIGCIESDKMLTRFIASIVESDEVDNENEEWLTIIQVWKGAVHKNSSETYNKMSLEEIWKKGGGCLKS